MVFSQSFPNALFRFMTRRLMGGGWLKAIINCRFTGVMDYLRTIRYDAVDVKFKTDESHII